MKRAHIWNVESQVCAPIWRLVEPAWCMNAPCSGGGGLSWCAGPTVTLTRLLVLSGDNRTLAHSCLARPSMTVPAFRVGEGWDTHALVLDRPLILGGVTIPHTHGLLGHSDADALLHAFPDADAQFKGADSVVLLQEAARRVRANGWDIGNLDTTIVAQAPKMAPHIPLMRTCIAQALGLSEEQVNVKAKTAEKMGPVGEGRAIEARAICLLYKA